MLKIKKERIIMKPVDIEENNVETQKSKIRDSIIPILITFFCFLCSYRNNQPNVTSS